MNTNLEEAKKQQPAKPRIRRLNPTPKLIGISIVIVILVITLGIMWLYGYNYSKNKAANQIEELERRIAELENTPVVVDPVTPEIVQSVLTSQTKEISELTSAEYLFTNAARFTDTKDIAAIFDWMTEKSFVQKWDGAIKAGVDLTDVSVKVNNQVITVYLPKAEILSYEVDYDSVEVLDEKNNVFNPISVDDKNNFDKETAEEMKARAIENGLLEKAQKNAENIIKNLLMAAVENIQEYTIEFEITELTE